MKHKPKRCKSLLREKVGETKRNIIFFCWKCDNYFRKRKRMK